MKRAKLMVFLVGAAFFWFGFTGILSAATFLGKVATDGKVEIVGEVTNTFLHSSSTYPLLANSELITHEGRGLIKLSGGTVVTSPRSVVQALKEGDRVTISIKKGKILYRLSPYKANVSIRTLDGEIFPRKVGITRASTNSLNTGRISVMEGKTIVEVNEGSLQVMTPKGATTVSAGQSLLLDQAGIETFASSKELMGKTGSAKTQMRPGGMVQIEGEIFKGVVVDDNLQPITSLKEKPLPEGTAVKVVGRDDLPCFIDNSICVQPLDRSLIATFLLPGSAVGKILATGGIAGTVVTTIVANTTEGGGKGGEEASRFTPKEE